MRKIPTIFERDWNGDRSRVVDKPHADCGWVFAGEGAATRKLDGQCCMIRDGKLYKRREIKKGQVAPPDFEMAGFDEETGKSVGWLPVTDAPEDRWFREAIANTPNTPDGTYEAVGPHHQGGADGDGVDRLLMHSEAHVYTDAPRTFDALRDWLTGRNFEGLVWHHPDGRMAKIKLRDFGLKRAP